MHVVPGYAPQQREAATGPPRPVYGISGTVWSLWEVGSTFSFKQRLRARGLLDAKALEGSHCRWIACLLIPTREGVPEPPSTRIEAFARRCILIENDGFDAISAHLPDKCQTLSMAAVQRIRASV